MKYSAEKAWFHFIHNKGKYGALILVYAVSLALFIGCLNLSLTCERQMRAIREQARSTGVELSFMGAYMQEYTVTPQDLADYPGMEENLFYFPYRDSHTVDSDGNEYRYHCCFLSDAVFEQLFGMEREAGEIYIGRGAYDTLNRLKERAALQREYDSYLYYRFEGDTAYLEENPVVNLSQVTLLSETQGEIRLNTSAPVFSLDEEQVVLSDCLILPLEMLEEMDYETDALPYRLVILIYEGEQDEKGMSELMGFIRFLAGRHPEVQYGISDRVLSLEKAASDLMIPYRMLLLAAVSMLLIIMTGMIGIFILILHRRKKEQAVSLAYGATRGQIFLEVFLEVFLCFAAGGVLAGAAAWYITPRMVIRGLSLTGAWHSLTTLCAVGITLAEALGISGIALAVVGRENVAGTLKEL